jgi:HAE1 family hydrophobic/amphiphilic exporter-1
VIYLYLDKLSNAFAGWGRSGHADLDRDDTEHGPIKQAAE